MAKEVYRVEIPIEATDNYSAEIKKAERSVTQFEAAVKRSTSNAKKRRDDFNRGRWSMTLNAVDKASRVVSRVSSYVHRVANRSYRFTLRAFDMATRTIGGIKRAITSIPALVTITLGVIGADKLKDATVGAAMSFEQYEVSMTHWLGGNEKKAKNLVKWMGQFADTTPFSSVDLFPALTRGIGVSGGDVKQAQDLLKLSADMASLTPGSSVSDAMEALADAQMGEMERLKAFNVKISKKEMDKIGYAGVVKQLTKKFDGGAKKLSQTSLGIISTLKGYRSSLFRAMGTGFLDPMKPRLDSINNWLANNQETWGRWKDTVKRNGKQASEFVFSNLEKGFGFVRSRYLDNKEFMDLSFRGKIDFIIGDINEWWSSKGKPAVDDWWDGTGKPWAGKLGLSVGEAIFEGMKAGLTTGLETIGELWSNVGETAKKNGIFSKETAKSAGGAGIATLGAGAIAAMALSPLLKGGGSLLRGGKKGFGGLFGAGRWVKEKTTGGKTGTTPVSPPPSSGKTQQPKPSKPPKNAPVILDQNGRPLAPSGQRPTSKPTTQPQPKNIPTKSKGWEIPKGLNPKNWKMPKGLDKISKFGKRVPLLGTLLGAASIFSAPKGEKAKVTGGFGGMLAGGAAGAAGGAAVGSVVPFVGTAIGGVLGGIGGGILGGMGGEKLGGWLGDKFGSKKAKAAETNSPAQVGVADSSGAMKEAEASAKAMSSAFKTMADKALQGVTNMGLLVSYLGEASGWIVGAFNPLVGSTANIKTNAILLASYLGQASGWVVQGFYGLSDSSANLKSNLSILTSYVGQASGWVVEGFYGLSGSTANLQSNLSILTSYTGQASGWVVGGFSPIQQNGAVLNNNLSVLSMYVGQASAWVVAGLYPIAERGPVVSNNLSILAMYLGMASSWVVGLQGIQSGGAAVSAALNGLAARINSTPAPSVSASAPSSSGRRGGPKPVAYANGGQVNRPHLGLVGEAGPEMIIPLSSGRRNRAMELFNRTASLLGVRPYAEGGLAGAEPIVPGYGSSSPAVSLAGTMGGTIKGSANGAVHVSAPITVEINGGGADESFIKEVIYKYGREFVDNLREALNNRPMVRS